MREIAQQILDHDGSYVLALKANQGTLHDEVRASCATAQAAAFAGIRHDAAETIETGHDRIETRQARVIDDPAVIAWLHERHAWPGLQASGLMRSERRRGAERTVEERY